ncbi:MAG TPA: glycosyltransferase [Propionicimonas sp.]
MTEAVAPARTRVLVVTLDTIAPAMAGPAIRAWEISRELSRTCDVALVTFGACSRDGEGFAVRQVDVPGFRAEVDAVDVVVIQGFVVRTFPWLQEVPQYIVIDLYDPFQLETLEVDRYQPEPIRWEALGRARGELDAQVRRGDLFLCASGRQRDLWLGHLAAAGRVNPATYDDDPSLTRLITIVPFGMSSTPPRRTAARLKGVVDGIGPDDKVILWGGGVYNWFDPLTLVRAMEILSTRDPAVRLLFLGMRHPNPDVPEMAVAVRTQALADELGLTGKSVFFHEQWVPYDERADYLVDADVGVSCHFPHVETEFSFRTRILDYLWASLPVVCTTGDEFARLIEATGAGVAVPPEDPERLADALQLALDAERGSALREGSARLARGFRWDEVLAPLAAYCAAPWHAADRGVMSSQNPAAVRASIARDARSALRHLRAGGVRQLLRKVRWRLARRG